MNDYRLIESHIRRARLERSVVIGDIIASGIFAAWSGAKRLAFHTSARIKSLLKTLRERAAMPPIFFF